jgi:hypothetical protein
MNAKEFLEAQMQVVRRHRERMENLFRSLPLDEKTQYLKFWNREGGRHESHR